MWRKKEEIWRSPMTKAIIHVATEKSKKQSDNTKTPTTTSFLQRIQTDFGRSIRVTTATQLVW